MPLSGARLAAVALSFAGHLAAGYLVVRGGFPPRSDPAEVLVELLVEEAERVDEAKPDPPAGVAATAPSAGNLAPMEPTLVPPMPVPRAPAQVAAPAPRPPDMPLPRPRRTQAVPAPPAEPQVPAAAASGGDAGAAEASTELAALEPGGAIESAASFADAALGNPPPVYPQRARLRGQEGTVRLLARIDPQGQLSELRLIESSGHALLDRAAREAVERWRFRPATRAGQSVAGELVVPILFRFLD